MAMKKFFGLVSVAALVASAYGCSSSTDPGTPILGDAGKVDAKKPDTGTVKPPTEAGPTPPPPDSGPNPPPPDSGPPPPPPDGGPIKPEAGPIEPDAGPAAAGPGTTGASCKVKSDCDVNGDGTQFCTNANIFSAGLIWPDPMCIGLCTLSQPATDDYTASAEPCDINAAGDDFKGFCFAGAGETEGTCFPKCYVDATGTVVDKCLPRAACSISWGAVGGGLFGTCEPGCRTDADCTALPGNKCDIPTGQCLKKPREIGRAHV